MAITATTTAKPTRAFLGTGWQFPIRVNAQGGLNYSSGEENIAESIWVILATAQGERQMRPQFGCSMQEFVFASNNPSTFGNVAHLVRKALTEYEPRVDVRDVQVQITPDEPNKVLIRVDYRIRSTNAYHNLVYPFFVQEGPGQ
ncbi:MAG: baseplate protein [Acidobacteria bacterium 13_2_20CM_57_17]|nr:MAG: baseplate protein [Acidobacteria bacterium 13_2_20CM_57_17]OLB95619.1 MAG: baseplate protein [Acidobacteria bacterium 13_2_20CM_2_57_12]